uniref:Uncharacterized protein n=1 Tax=Ailuropoda melanoleuca TaxID=9646 RepID=A0A7N5P920_AILME
MNMQNCSSFLIKRNKQTYSTEPNNLKACNFYHDGLIHCKTVGMELAAYDKYVVVVMNWRYGQQTLPPPACGPPSAKMPRPPSTASDT